MDTNKEDELEGTLTRAQRIEVAQDAGDRRPLLIGICENIIRNNGEFKPELEPGIEVTA